MAGGGTPEGRGRRFDFQLNLVPMIDLLSVMISFLLITAVWTQISRIDVKQHPEGGETVATPPVDALGLRVLIKSGGYATTTRDEVRELPGHDHRILEDALRAVRLRWPDQEAVVVSSEDAVAYQELITVMDLCLKHGLREISVDGW